MNYGITSNKPNIDFAAKEIVLSKQTGTFTCVATGGTFQNVGNGFSITIPKTRMYKITCEYQADIAYSAINSQHIFSRLAVDGVEIDGTCGVTYKNFGGSLDVRHHVESPIQTFTAGQVITLQVYKTEADPARIFYTNGNYEGFIQAEMISAFVNVYDEDKIYSDTELPTGRIWRDGKPIYRKVINFGAMPNAALKQVAHGITTPDVIVNMYGTARNTTTNDKRVLPHVNVSGAGSAIQMVADNTNISINSGTTDRTALNECFITMEYTKV